MQLAYAARKAYKSPVYIIKYALSGTPLVTTTAPTWNPNVSGSLYSLALTEISEALAALSGKTVSVEGMLWLQGEADGVAGQTRATYAARQTELFAGIRAAVSLPALPIVDMLIRGNTAAINTINDAKRDVQAAVPNIKLVDANALGALADGVHLSGAGQVGFADQAFSFLGPR